MMWDQCIQNVQEPFSRLNTEEFDRRNKENQLGIMGNDPRWGETCKSGVGWHVVGCHACNFLFRNRKNNSR
jgi:hypothetical protein